MCLVKTILNEKNIKTDHLDLYDLNQIIYKILDKNNTFIFLDTYTPNTVSNSEMNEDNSSEINEDRSAEINEDSNKVFILEKEIHHLQEINSELNNSLTRCTDCLSRSINDTNEYLDELTEKNRKMDEILKKNKMFTVIEVLIILVLLIAIVLS